MAEQEAEQATAQAPLPTIADVDSDGDLDLVVFGDAGGVQFIEQLDNGTFAQRTGWENPLSFLDEIYCSETALPDQSLTYRTCQPAGNRSIPAACRSRSATSTATATTTWSSVSGA